MNIYNFLIELVKKVFRYKFIILGCLVISVAIGVFLFKKTKPYYNHIASVYSPVIDAYVGGEIILALQMDLNRGNRTNFKEKLKLTEEQFETIQEINIIMESKEAKSFRISMKTNSVEYLDVIEKALLFYLNDHPISKEYSDLTIERYESSVAYMKVQIDELDSLSKNSNTNTDIGSLYKNKVDIVDLSNAYLMNIEKNRLLFTYIHGFSRGNNSPSGPILRNFLLMSFFTGIVISVIIIFFIELKNMES